MALVNEQVKLRGQSSSIWLVCDENSGTWLSVGANIIVNKKSQCTVSFFPPVRFLVTRSSFMPTNLINWLLPVFVFCLNCDQRSPLQNVFRSQFEWSMHPPDTKFKFV
ncbi:hypothetical protein QR680_004668 [Steinernema hermaphroditum]|uniref:Uncharacterized protein n=1 Tax=Steinernema hermaphroditum TaxID=289476 RepID=A0AA39LUC5_9BILA|nr:hypothetical protein QR680_004668 [Steinernema hermaphroditum]